MLLAMRARRLAIPILLTLVACSGGPRAAAVFSGSAEPARSQPDEIRELSALPVGYESLGTLTSSCRLTPEGGEIHDAWLSDVQCSEELLAQALRERAAEVGGELLIGRHCASRIQRRELGELDVHCRAVVGRPTEEELGRRPPDRVRPAPGESVSATERFRIRVDVTRAAGAPRRRPRRGDEMSEVATLPVSHVQIADVEAQCDQGCTERGVHGGLLEVAARIGATALVDARCVRRGTGFACLGTAAGLAVDPDQDPRAR
jgi:hypothetical protein